ncbi:MAG: thioredoxin domain-containing protein [Candidatus Heimdallarchaeota archaeon]
MSQKNNEHKYNRLIHEKSPYLLQHAQNPVDWYPWGEEAFEKARKEDKPLFLSIGYSTCHWCHVMEKESFEDPEVAQLMNDTFMSIKVDREERPDIDKLYMSVCQMMTGGGGWPLTILMTPNKKPFWVGTYIPKDSRFGRLGMLDFVPRIKEMWLKNRDQVVSVANEMITDLQWQLSTISGGDEDIGESTLKFAYEILDGRFDERDGGFGHAPKFPSPHVLRFLLRYWKRTGKEKALEMVEKTLQAMRRGGIYDHVGFGFHRYSTDPQWLLPHFEKMLYDQALLAMAYIEVYQATHNPEYKKTAQEIFTYVLRDMTSPEGGFYSAEDADSEGVEGKFYIWTKDEILQILNQEDTDFVVQVFNLEKDGNFAEEATHEKTGANILHLRKSLTEISVDMQIPKADLRIRLESIRQKLLEVREKRVHPLKDDKILVDWNGLMIAALAKGAQVFGEYKYVEATKNAVRFLLTTLRTPEGRILHRYRDGEAAISANIDDYAFLIWGLLELYETTFDVNYLLNALELTKTVREHFWDEEVGGFYFTPDDGDHLLIRQKEIYDGALPSGNSVFVLNLLRLGRMTVNPEFEEEAARIGRTFSLTVNQGPASFTQLLVGIDFGLGPSYEVVIAGNSQAQDTQKMLQALRTHFLPNMIVLLNPIERESPEIFNVVEFIKHQTSRNGKATAYICLDYVCNQPTTDIDKMLELLNVEK